MLSIVDKFVAIKISRTECKSFINSRVNLLGICFLVVLPIEAKTRLPQYGLDSVEGFCEGWGELDQLGDIASQMLNTKYPYMGSMRVS